MRVGYMMNTYPVTSGTFIRREIEALEARGVDVRRYAVRRWDQALVDPDDRAEAEKVTYLLSGRAGELGLALAREAARRPANLGRALPVWRRLTQSTPGFIRPLAYLAEATLLRQMTARDGITHLHCHFGTNTTAVAMLCRLMGGPSYSFTAHGPDEFDNGPALRFDLKLRHAAFAVAITHFARMQMLRFGGLEHRDKIHVARCGLSLPDFRPSSDCQERKILTCVGRLCPQKGQSLLPEAIAPLLKEHPDLKLVLIGDGESRPQIEAEIRRFNLEDNVELTGWMANEDVRARIAGSRALVLPSFAEGLPIVIMEAMALKRPVISTYIAGIPELLDEKAGWIVPASDVDGLRAAIRDCLNAGPGTLTSLGNEARRRIEERHDIAKLAERLEELFGALPTLSQADGATAAREPLHHDHPSERRVPVSSAS